MLSGNLLLMTTILFFGQCTSKNLHSHEQSSISKIEVFIDLEERGYTTAGAYSHFKDLVSNGVSKVEVSTKDREKIERILSRAKVSVHRQTKLGIRNVFALIEIKNPEDSAIQINKVVINIGEEETFVVNLSGMKEYKVTLPEDLVWIKKFHGKLKLLGETP